ncbi:hypothetical protein M3J09_011716 [Ascochyta lentis]
MHVWTVHGSRSSALLQGVPWQGCVRSRCGEYSPSTFIDRRIQDRAGTALPLVASADHRRYLLCVAKVIATFCTPRLRRCRVWPVCIRKFRLIAVQRQLDLFTAVRQCFQGRYELGLGILNVRIPPGVTIDVSCLRSEQAVNSKCSS